ncbi:tRNAHis guanylyltransferase, putative [Plasmodium malariae]|uniref:tRNA(His) guanylyltransferase n=1 Tax=Plasmodium malariae TaxID=5858 RepID=A0A1C3KAA3_PLAMA|nr:tRNAHis guanylyltransferase, putative [Plasmodium malariae]
MANSKFAYVKLYEEEKKIMLNCYFIIRIDGCDFKKFIKVHEYKKPNDIRGLHLMNECAIGVIKKYDEIDMCYGHSDEFSFLFRKNAKLWNRRYDKILTSVVSYFTSYFMYRWKFYFFNKELVYPPCFDARIIIYPSEKEIKDYFSWRQVDCHINTQYNECFWNLVLKSNYTHEQAYKFLLTTQTKDKNELLFSKFHINYNNIPDIFRRGTIIIRNKNFKKKENMKCTTSSCSTTIYDHNSVIISNATVHLGPLKNTNENKLDKNTHEKLIDDYNLCTISKDDDIINAEVSIATSSEQQKINTLNKFIISHENLVSEKFWGKYDFIFKKKGTGGVEGEGK